MKLKKYQFITLLLIIYAVFMTCYFGLDLLKTGQELRFYATLIGEMIVITLTYFALRRKETLRKRREK